MTFLSALILHAEFQAGFSRVDMMPPIGTGLSGYSQERVSDGVIGAWDDCEQVPAGKVGFGVALAKAKTNRAAPEEIPEAQRIMDLVRVGKFDQVPGKGMQRTTNEAAARRKVYLKDGPDYFNLPLSIMNDHLEQLGRLFASGCEKPTLQQ